MQNKTKPLNTSLLSLIQFIGAILVIALHCRRLFETDQLHFIQNQSLVAWSFLLHGHSQLLPPTQLPQPLQTIPNPLQQAVPDLVRPLPTLLPLLPKPPRNPLLHYPLTPSRTDLHRHQLPTLVHARLPARSCPCPLFFKEMGLAHHSLSSLPSLSSRLSRNLLLLPGRIDFPDRI